MKSGRYLKYAIGEIFLVMIGILLALGINNWNESRKSDDELIAILSEIRKDIKGDLAIIDRILNNGKAADSVARVLYSGAYDSRTLSLKEQRNMFFKVLQYVPFDYNTAGFDKLNDFTGSIPASFENTIAAINVQYNNLGAIYRSIYKSTADYVSSRHNYLALNMPWYRDFRDGNLTPEAIKFFTEGHVYENWVAQFVRDNLYQKYGILHSYMAGSLSSLILINQSLDITGDQQINAHIAPSNSTSVDYAGIYEPKNGATPIIVNLIDDYLFIENLVYEQVNDSTFQSYTYGLKIYFRNNNEKSPTTLTYNDLFGALEAIKKE